jgi:hypothetical protein
MTVMIWSAGFAFLSFLSALGSVFMLVTAWDALGMSRIDAGRVFVRGLARAAIFAVPPAPCAVTAWRDRRRLRTRAAQGRCLACGYDLRTNQTGVCPECGAATKEP